MLRAAARRIGPDLADTAGETGGHASLTPPGCFVGVPATTDATRRPATAGARSGPAAWSSVIGGQQAEADQSVEVVGGQRAADPGRRGGLLPPDRLAGRRHVVIQAAADRIVEPADKRDSLLLAVHPLVLTHRRTVTLNRIS